jgi:hypothetical protein
MGVLFGITLFLNSISLIPSPTLFGTTINYFGDLLVFITLILAASFIIREER